MNKHNERAELIARLRDYDNTTIERNRKDMLQAAAMLEEQPAEQVAALKKRDLTGLGPDNGASTYFRGLGWNEAIDAMALQPAEQANGREAAWRNFLERMEWSDWRYDRFGDGQAHCPDCGNQREEGHEKDCELASMLRATQLAQPAREWVSISDDEIYDMYSEPRSDAEMVEFARAIESKLREKNAGLPAADDKKVHMLMGEQSYAAWQRAERRCIELQSRIDELESAADDKAGGEPVAHVTVEPLRRDEYKRRVAVNWIKEPVAGPLYTHPQPQAEVRVPDGLPLVISGAIFDFAGYLTTRKEVIEVGSTANASPMADLVKEWAELRGLSLDDAAVLSWNELLAAPKPQDDLPAILKKQTS